MGYRAVLAAVVVLFAAVPVASAQDIGEQWDTHTRAAVKAYGLAQMDIAAAEANAALAIAEKNFKPGDDRLQTSVLNSFSIERGMGHYDAALTFGMRLEAMQRKADPKDPNLAITVNLIAGVYRDMKSADPMVATYNRAIDLAKTNIGEFDPYTVAVREDYAAALGEAGRGEEGAKLWPQIAKDWAVALGPDHLRISISYAGYAQLLRSLGRTAEADAAAAESARIADVYARQR